MMGLAGSLLVFTGFWHATEWLMARRHKDTLRLIPFGIAYLILGCLIVTFTGGQLVVCIAFAVTVLGLLAVWFTRRTSLVRPWVTRVFIVLNVLIIAGLASVLIGS